MITLESYIANIDHLDILDEGTLENGSIMMMANEGAKDFGQKIKVMIENLIRRIKNFVNKIIVKYKSVGKRIVVYKEAADEWKSCITNAHKKLNDINAKKPIISINNTDYGKLKMEFTPKTTDWKKAIGVDYSDEQKSKDAIDKFFNNAASVIIVDEIIKTLNDVTKKLNDLNSKLIKANDSNEKLYMNLSYETFNYMYISSVHLVTKCSINTHNLQKTK